MSEEGHDEVSGRMRLFIGRTQIFISVWVSLSGAMYFGTGFLGLFFERFAGIGVLQCIGTIFMLTFGIYCMGIWMGMRPSKRYWEY